MRLLLALLAVACSRGGTEPSARPRLAASATSGIANAASTTSGIANAASTTSGIANAASATSEIANAASATSEIALVAPAPPSATSPAVAAPKSRCITPESVGAVALPELKATSPVERRALVAARAELERVLEKPHEFFAVVQATDDLVLLELWHRSAFSPEHCNEAGNPGGKCRTLGYDPKRGRIVSTKFWQ